jgi:acyl carrier protein
MNNILSENDTKAVLDILVEQLGTQREQLTPEARLQEDLGADSLTIAEITLALEEQFHLAIPDEVWERVSTVSDVFEVLAELLCNSTRRTA